MMRRTESRTRDSAVSFSPAGQARVTRRPPAGDLIVTRRAGKSKRVFRRWIGRAPLRPACRFPQKYCGSAFLFFTGVL